MHCLNSWCCTIAKADPQVIMSGGIEFRCVTDSSTGERYFWPRKTTYLNRISLNLMQRLTYLRSRDTKLLIRSDIFCKFRFLCHAHIAYCALDVLVIFIRAYANRWDKIQVWQRSCVPFKIANLLTSVWRSQVVQHNVVWWLLWSLCSSRVFKQYFMIDLQLKINDARRRFLFH